MSKNPATPVTLPLSSHSCTDFLSLHAAWTACAAQEASSSLAAKNGIWLDHWGVLSKETYRKPTGNHDFSHERCKLCKFSHQVWKGWLRQPKNMKVMVGHRPTWNQQRIIGTPLRGMLGLNLSDLSCSRFTVYHRYQGFIWFQNGWFQNVLDITVKSEPNIVMIYCWLFLVVAIVVFPGHHFQCRQATGSLLGELVVAATAAAVFSAFSSGAWDQAIESCRLRG